MDIFPYVVDIVADPGVSKVVDPYHMGVKWCIHCTPTSAPSQAIEGPKHSIRLSLESVKHGARYRFSFEWQLAMRHEVCREGTHPADAEDPDLRKEMVSPNQAGLPLPDGQDGPIVLGFVHGFFPRSWKVVVKVKVCSAAVDSERMAEDWVGNYSFLTLFKRGPLLEDIGTDCHFECRGSKFFAHRVVIFVRSSVLQAALTTEGMKEQTESCVVIDDFAPNVVGAFLLSLYEPRLLFRVEPDQLSLLKETFKLHHRYCNDDPYLRSAVTKVLCERGTTQQHIFDTLQFAFTYDLDEVLSRCVDKFLPNTVPFERHPRSPFDGIIRAGHIKECLSAPSPFELSGAAWARVVDETPGLALRVTRVMSEKLCKCKYMFKV